jgi:hypothetical protein
MPSPLKILRAEIVRQQSTLQPDDMPLVSLELFFGGNADLASIGCNLDDHPGIEKFRDTFLRIESRTDVDTVLVAISEVMEDDEWPFSDTVIIVTSAPLDDVRSWVADLEPSDVLEPDDYPVTNLPKPVPPGMRHLAVWWD